MLSAGTSPPAASSELALQCGPGLLCLVRKLRKEGSGRLLLRHLCHLPLLLLPSQCPSPTMTCAGKLLSPSGRGVSGLGCVCPSVRPGAPHRHWDGSRTRRRRVFSGGARSWWSWGPRCHASPHGTCWTRARCADRHIARSSRTWWGDAQAGAGTLQPHPLGGRAGAGRRGGSTNRSPCVGWRWLLSSPQSRFTTERGRACGHRAGGSSCSPSTS